MTKHVTPYPFTMIPVDMTFNQNLSDGDIRVFLTIASLSGYDEIRPSVNWIAEQTNKSDSTVRRAIAKLTECGYLSTYERYNDKTGARLSNGYRLEHPMYQRVTPLSPVNTPPFHSYDNSPPSPVTPKIDISNTDKESKGAYSELLVNEYKRRGMPLDNALVASQIEDAANDLSSALDRKGLPNPYHMSIDDLKAMIAWLQEPAQSWVDFSASTFTSKAIRAKFATRNASPSVPESRYKKLG